ncbi:hypothetical protein BH09PAT2_BH09PAT2_07450 [soil metagenome]
MTTLLSISEDSENQVINQTIEVLKSGGIVIFPSDTVYGLLVDATNEKAVEKLITFKNRPPGKAISVFVSDFEMMNTVVVANSKQKLLETILPGPFTIILESKHAVSKKLESEKDTLGVRFPDNAFIQKLVKAYGKPITATSANLGGKSPHYSIQSLLNQLPKNKQDLIDLIVDGGKLPRNKPSTILDLTSDSLKILRHGDIVLKDSKNYTTTTAAQTYKLGAFIASTLVKKYDGQPMVCILKGDLGAGKTQLTKGIASYFEIIDIVSPTFVVYYEYDIAITNYKKFIHVDLYNIEEEEEFKHLGLEQYLEAGHVMCIEWGEKLGDMYRKLAEKAAIVYIEIQYIGEKEREIVVNS